MHYAIHAVIHSFCPIIMKTTLTAAPPFALFTLKLFFFWFGFILFLSSSTSLTYSPSVEIMIHSLYGVPDCLLLGFSHLRSRKKNVSFSFPLLSPLSGLMVLCHGPRTPISPLYGSEAQKEVLSQLLAFASCR